MNEVSKNIKMSNSGPTGSNGAIDIRSIRVVRDSESQKEGKL
jgi:hypothetical protein